MDKQLARYVSNLDSVKGWFRESDAFALDVITSIQRSRSIVGDVLEIGVFQGKSAIVLGMLTDTDETLHVCDVFEMKTDNAANDLEYERSYRGLQQQVFERNYLKWQSELPKIHVMTSSQMFKSIGDEQRFRLIHVDGGHLYREVRDDLRNSISRISVGGVICFDDWKVKAGVAAALWEAASNGHISPFLLTDSKMYAAIGDTQTLISDLEIRLADKTEVSWLIEEIHTKPVLRMFWDGGKAETPAKRIVRNIIPPGIYAVGSRFMKNRTSQPV